MLWRWQVSMAVLCAKSGSASPLRVFRKMVRDIAEADPHLPALAHEPRQALVSGADGLDDIRRIVAQAPAHLAPGGWLLLEHGWHQAGAVRALLSAAGFAQVQSRRDLAGIERGSGGQYPDRRAQSSEKLSN